MRRFPFVLSLSLLLNFILWSGAAALLSRAQNPGLERFEVRLQASGSKRLPGVGKRGIKKPAAAASRQSQSQPIRPRSRRVTFSRSITRANVSLRQTKTPPRRASTVPRNGPNAAPVTPGKSQHAKVDEGDSAPFQPSGNETQNPGSSAGDSTSTGDVPTGSDQPTGSGSETNHVSGAPVEPTSEPIATVAPTPTPVPTATPTQVPTPTPTSKPEPTPTPTPRPTPTRQPEPMPTPRPSGPPSRAVATRQIVPRIPEELRNADLHASVSVSAEIDQNGAATYSLRSSSGNAAVDSLVLKALKRWKWKPALRDGEPVTSTQNFRFELEVK